MSRKVHREEGDLGADVSAAKPIAILEAVDDREIAIASKVHVFEPQVAVAVAYATIRKPTSEDPRAITEEVELPPLHLACLDLGEELFLGGVHLGKVLPSVARDGGGRAPARDRDASRGA